MLSCENHDLPLFDHPNDEDLSLGTPKPQNRGKNGAPIVVGRSREGHPPRIDVYFLRMPGPLPTLAGVTEPPTLWL